MDSIVIKNANIILPDGILYGASLTAENGIIKKIDRSSDVQYEGNVIDADGRYLSAGFVDIHIHGGGGSDFIETHPDTYKNIIGAHIKHGTTSFAPTFLGSGFEEIVAGINTYKTAKAHPFIGGRLLGIHLEGPYISLGQAGAQPPEFIRSPQPEEYREIIREGGGHIIRWSVAPELDGMEQFCAYIKSQGILPSIAHSDAEYSQAEKAYRDGFTLITHLYSAMSTIKRVKGFRVAGVLESAFLLDGMNVEIIADGCHLPAELLKFVYKFKKSENIVLITDSMRASGQVGVTSSYLGTQQNGVPCIIEDGVAKLPDRSAFAGSIATTDRLLRTMVKQAEVPLIDAVRMLTENPIKVSGLTVKKGKLQVGFDADMVLFDDDINISAVIAAGSVVYDGKSVIAAL